MRFLFLLLITAAILPVELYAQENIRGIFFENGSPHMLGVRLINRRSRVEDHYLFPPESKEHVDTKIDSFTLSAQLVTASYPIDCCEWTLIHSGDTVVIEYLPERNRCWCKIK